MCPFRIVAKIESGEDAVLDKLLVNCDYELAAIVRDQFSTRVVYARPMRLRADGQPDRRDPAVEQTVSAFKSETAELYLVPIVESAHARD